MVFCLLYVIQRKILDRGRDSKFFGLINKWVGFGTNKAWTMVGKITKVVA